MRFGIADPDSGDRVLGMREQRLQPGTPVSCITFFSKEDAAPADERDVQYWANHIITVPVRPRRPG